MLSAKQNSHRILAYGHEADLLETRCMVLRQAGFHVDAASSAKEFEACLAQAEIPYRLFLLGHTIPVAEQRKIAESTANSTTAVYQLTEAVSPQHLIDRLSELLRSSHQL
jgi:DNA-binding response OmpR family regulator